MLQTKNLNLSPCQPADCADFIDLERDAEVMRYLNGGHVVDRKSSAPDPTFLMPNGTETDVWTARRKSNGAFVGWFCLSQEGERVGELGYRLRRSEWGQGLASEGAAALIGHSFKTGGFDRIFASTMTTNHASRRVLEKIGMHYARTVKLDWPKPFPGSDEGEVEYEVMCSNKKIL